jgi:hypothetical protein
MGCGESKPQLTAADYVQGMREALYAAVRLTVGQLGREGGYYNDAEVRVPTPTFLGDIFEVLQDAPGIGEKITDFEKKLNRAAEKAAAASTQTFIDAITAMQFQDAKALIEGGGADGTAFFKATCEQQLYDQFKPICEKELEGEGAATALDGLLKAHAALIAAKNAVSDAAASAKSALMGAFGQKEEPAAAPQEPTKSPGDINEYVAQKAIDGIWHVLPTQERKVRNDPAHHTAAMKKVMSPQKA